MKQSKFNFEKIIDKKVDFFIFEFFVQIFEFFDQTTSFFEFFDEITFEVETKTLSIIEFTFFFFYSFYICDCFDAKTKNEKNLIIVNDEKKTLRMTSINSKIHTKQMHMIRSNAKNTSKSYDKIAREKVKNKVEKTTSNNSIN